MHTENTASTKLQDEKIVKLTTQKDELIGTLKFVKGVINAESSRRELTAQEQILFNECEKAINKATS